MTCDAEKLQAMVDGEPAGEAFERHVAECVLCREEADRLRDFSGRVALAVRAYGNAVEIPPHAGRRRIPWVGLIPAAAAVLLAVGAMLWSRPRTDARLDALAERAASIDGDALIPVALYLADIDERRVGGDAKPWLRGEAGGAPSTARQILFDRVGRLLDAGATPRDPEKVVDYRQTASRGGVSTEFSFTQWDTGLIEISWKEESAQGSRSENLSASSLAALRGAHLDLLERFELVGEGGALLVGLPFERPDTRAIADGYLANGRDLRPELDKTLESLYASRLARRVRDRADFDARLASFRSSFLASEDRLDRLDAFLNHWSRLPTGPANSP